MSDSVRPHRQQPTRLPRPWDSPGKNTGVSFISFSNAWKWKVKVKSLSRVRLLATPWTAAHQAPQSWDFPDKSTGVGCHCLLPWSIIGKHKFLNLPEEEGVSKTCRVIYEKSQILLCVLICLEMHLRLTLLLYVKSCQHPVVSCILGTWIPESLAKLMSPSECSKHVCQTWSQCNKFQ